MTVFGPVDDLIVLSYVHASILVHGHPCDRLTGAAIVAQGDAGSTLHVHCDSSRSPTGFWYRVERDARGKITRVEGPLP